jgi:hypothetical protein
MTNVWKLGIAGGIGLSLVIGLAALFAALGQPAPPPIFEQQAVTGFNELHLSGDSATATPVFLANQAGAGRILELQDAGTPVFTVDDGGAWSATGSATFAGVDLNGTTLTIDADADTTLVASSDDLISTTLGAATGRLTVLTGNLAVGNGSPGVTLNGEDAYVEGTFEVDGAAQFDGTLTLESVAFSGPVTFGTATTVVSGTTIAHSLATTPTVAILTPQSTGGYTATVYVLATDDTNITVAVQDGVTVPTVNWLAGK